MAQYWYTFTVSFVEADDIDDGRGKVYDALATLYPDGTIPDVLCDDQGEEDKL